MAINDGSANAPIGTPQHADLLDSYGANRPPWEVAGVDYYVGAPQGVALKNPATISMAGVNINTSTKAVTITGNNVTLDGYDFSGWSVVTTAANTSLIHSNFNGTNPGGTQTSVISGTPTSSNLYVGYSTIDGLSGGGRAEFLVEMEGPGLTVEYSWLKNSNSDLIGRHGNDGGDITIQNNVMEQAGMGGAGVHGDYLQVYGPDINATRILYNTTVQNGGITQGFFADNTKSAEIAGNTFTGDFNFFVSGSGPNTNPAALTGAFNVHDNYFDPTNTLGLSYPTYGENDKYALSLFTNNVNMVTGKVLQDANAPTKPPPTAPSAPTISSFSNDTGVAGDKITSDNTLTLTGSAAANSTVKVFDGATQIGTATANASGAWSYTTAALADGAHNLTAKATDASGQTGAASAALAVKIDTTAPNAPTIATPSNNANGTVNLTGTAEANSTVKVFDGANQIGTATANSNGAWSLTTGTLATGNHSFTAKAADVAGNTSAASAVVVGNIPPTTPTTPDAPKIASYSNDSGVAGDGVTNDNTLTLTGTAVANSTVKVFDGTTQIGTATASASGAWSYTTAALADGGHSLTVKVTDAAGNTSAASSALAVKIDTSAPNAPTMASSATTGSSLTTAADKSANPNTVSLTGTAEANSTVKVFDGATQIGTATADSSGVWSFTSGTLATGNHTFTSKAMDAAGNTSAASAGLVVNIPSTPTTPNVPAAPKISSFSNDTGVAGDKITGDNTLTLTGSAAANSTVKVFDGTTQIGTATANSSGAWSYTTTALADGSHNLTAKVTDASGNASAASEALAVKIDTTAPTAPKIASSTNANGDVNLTGTAEAYSTVKVFDGTKEIGAATADGKGAWTYAADNLSDGNHSFTTKAVDVAGNASASSTAFNVKVDATGPSAEFTKVYQNWNDTVTFKGTGEPYSKISIYDNGSAKPIGSVEVGKDGTWSYKTSSAVSDAVHNFTATVTDKAGNTSSLSGSAVLGTDGNDVLKSTSGNDLFKGNGGNDTFAFASNFGKDVVSNFDAYGRNHDVVQFSKSVFDDFADVLAHAAQSGRDVVIDAGGGNSLTLKDTKLAALDKTDFHFV